MIDQNGIPQESPLLDEKTRETIRGVFQKLNRDVTLKAALDVWRSEERRGGEAGVGGGGGGGG